MAAAVLAPLTQDGYRICLVESDEIGTVGVGEATIPQINLFNQALGIDEDEFLRATGGTFKLGIEFVDWGRIGDRYMHAFGDVGRDIGIVPFQHYWTRARKLGVGKDLRAYALNELAARAGKMQRGKLRTTDKLPPMPYAFHFDAGLYAAFLRHIAEARGVIRIEGKIVSAELEGESGNVGSVSLDDGRSIEGDLFLDCSGFRGLLIEGQLKTGFEDWSRWLPCDRALAAPSSHGAEGLIPYTRATARPAGWQWRIPLQHRVGNGYVYASAFTSDAHAEQLLLANLDGAPQADPRPLSFTAGRRRKFWNRNVIALGLASGFLEPLESTSIHLVQSSLQRLLELLPRGTESDVERAEFNRQTAAEYERVRDFLILHYKLTERDDSEFWRACRDMAVPDAVQHKVDLFRGAGHIVRDEQDLFAEVAWLQVMVGQGIVPERNHPMADSVSEADLQSYLDTWEALLSREVRQMPAHQDIIAQRCAAVAA
ncbi:tryptophan halogenase family protein [Sphingomonas piscis]|nr:tryptophan halogenase family protein [Sphingomonas piscis]